MFSLSSDVIGRFFNGYNEESFTRLIGGHPALLLCSKWVSEDARQGRTEEKWLNALLRTEN